MVKRAQVTLELALSICMAVILFLASAAIFLYLTERMVRRQQAYESSSSAYGRVQGAYVHADDVVQVDENALPGLDFFD